MVSTPFLVSFPRNFVSDFEGYELLAGFSLDTYAFRGREILLNMQLNEYFDATMCSPLGSIIAELKKRKNTVRLTAMQPEVEKMFADNGFIHQVDGHELPPRIYTTIVDYKTFSLSDTSAFQDYILTQLLDYKAFPKTSDLLKIKINKSIFEIFNNAHIHGNCDRVFTCGQFLERSGILKFSISDMGVTIRKNVNQHLGAGNKISGEDAIRWAVEEGHTTKSGTVPGGLGFSLIREFLGLNGGGIQIISSNGYWQEKKGANFSKAFKNRFLGTIVNLEFNLNDTKSYVLLSEINLKDIL